MHSSTTRPRTTPLALVLGTAILAATTVAAQPQVTMLDSVAVTGLSADGTVAAGNSTDGLHEACRWTAENGLVRLGRSTVAALGRRSGMSGISDDGNSIAASIISSDTAVTQGLWTKGIGWQETMPPVPPDGGELDQSYGAAFSVSGDGTTVVGFYFRPGATDGTAHANKWSAAGGLIDLGSQGRDSRANGVNRDGSVVVGWSASPTISVWQPTVWEDGGLTVLSETNLWCEAWGVNAAGTVVVGDAVDTTSYTLPMQTAAMWKKTGDGWQEYLLGVLPGTFGNGTGFARGVDVSEDGSVVVGYNQFDAWTYAGFVWTESQGMMEAEDFFAARGATFPPGFRVQGVSAVSDDGRVMAGYGKDPFDFQAPLQSFVVDLVGVSAVPRPWQSAELALTGIHPNPFNPATTIALDLRHAGHVRLEVFDVRGRLVRVLHDDHLAAGSHALAWDGRDDGGHEVASGVYFARARGAGAFTRAKAMSLVK